ncbi:hypothetical protein [Georgenia daeguensis]|uniref:Phospholipase n=1 Tax=Georgenia daeguensis TaxID=908355 RepID=A0ABP6UNK0_9MICO
MGHTILSRFSAAAAGLSMMSGAFPAAAASPATVPASHSSYDREHSQNDCWDANFYKHRNHWHVTWEDSDGTHNKRAQSYRDAVGQFADNCDRYSSHRDHENVRDRGRDKEHDRSR